MLNCSFYIPLFLYLIGSSRTDRNKRIFCNALTGWRKCGDKSKFVDSIKNGASVKVVSQVDGHITGFTHTKIYSDNMSIAGQYPWFICQNFDKDYFEFSKRVFWRPAIWSTVGEYRWSEWYVGEHTQRTSSRAHIPMKLLVDECWTHA